MAQVGKVDAEKRRPAAVAPTVRSGERQGLRLSDKNGGTVTATYFVNLWKSVPSPHAAYAAVFRDTKEAALRELVRRSELKGERQKRFAKSYLDELLKAHDAAVNGQLGKAGVQMTYKTIKGRPEYERLRRVADEHLKSIARTDAAFRRSLAQKIAADKSTDTPEKAHKAFLEGLKGRWGAGGWKLTQIQRAIEGAAKGAAVAAIAKDSGAMKKGKWLGTNKGLRAWFTGPLDEKTDGIQCLPLLQNQPADGYPLEAVERTRLHPNCRHVFEIETGAVSEKARAVLEKWAQGEVTTPRAVLYPGGMTFKTLWKSAWEEGRHLRNERGRFAAKGGGEGEEKKGETLYPLVRDDEKLRVAIEGIRESGEMVAIRYSPNISADVERGWSAFMGTWGEDRERVLRNHLTYAQGLNLDELWNESDNEKYPADNEEAFDRFIDDLAEEYDVRQDKNTGLWAVPHHEGLAVFNVDTIEDVKKWLYRAPEGEGEVTEGKVKIVAQLEPTDSGGGAWYLLAHGGNPESKGGMTFKTLWEAARGGNCPPTSDLPARTGGYLPFWKTYQGHHYSSAQVNLPSDLARCVVARGEENIPGKEILKDNSQLNLHKWVGLWKYNPYHYPKGHPKAGQFAPHHAGEGVVSISDPKAMEHAKRAGRQMADVRQALKEFAELNPPGKELFRERLNPNHVWGTYLKEEDFSERAKSGMAEMRRRGWLTHEGGIRHRVTEKGVEALRHLHEVNQWQEEGQRKVAEREAERLKQELQRKAALTLDEALGRMGERMRAVESSKPPIDVDKMRAVSKGIPAQFERAYLERLDKHWGQIKDLPLKERMAYLDSALDEARKSERMRDMEMRRMNKSLEGQGKTWGEIRDDGGYESARNAYHVSVWERNAAEFLRDEHKALLAKAMLPQGVKDNADLGATYGRRGEHGEALKNEMTGKVRSVVDEAAKWINASVHPEVMERMRQVPLQFQQRPAKSVAFHKDPGGVQPAVIGITETDGAWVAVHEYGHHLEYALPNAKAMANEFLRRRTEGETARDLAAITGNKAYSKRLGGMPEVAKPDKFIDAYVGKIYDSGHTEVVSMGLQYLFQDPVKFYQKDPEHFLLAASLVWGDTLGKKGA